MGSVCSSKGNYIKNKCKNILYSQYSCSLFFFKIVLKIKLETNMNYCNVSNIKHDNRTLHIIGYMCEQEVTPLINIVKMIVHDYA